MKLLLEQTPRNKRLFACKDYRILAYVNQKYIDVTLFGYCDDKDRALIVRLPVDEIETGIARMKKARHSKVESEEVADER